MSFPGAGQSPRFIYIAKEVGSPANQFKVGKTRQAVHARMQSMGGQTEAVFEVVAIFPTLDESTAESLAFELLDDMDMRKQKGSRKETFIGDLGAIEAVCKIATARADARYRARGLHKADQAVAKPASTPALTNKNKLWKAVLSAPATVAGKSSTVGELAALAYKQSGAMRRMENMGIAHKAHLKNGVELEIIWHKAPRIVEWLKLNKVEIPQALTSRFKATLANA